MEKLQITKDKIAQKYGFEAWDLFEFSRTPGLNIEALIDETITEYSSELLRQNREMKMALEMALMIMPDGHTKEQVKKCLTSCKKGKE